MEGAADNFPLLLLGELVEVDRITRNTDGEVGIKIGIFVSLDKLLLIEDVYVDVMRVLLEITVEDVYKIINS